MQQNSQWLVQDGEAEFIGAFQPDFFVAKDQMNNISEEMACRKIAWLSTFFHDEAENNTLHLAMIHATQNDLSQSLGQGCTSQAQDTFENIASESLLHKDNEEDRSNLHLGLFISRIPHQ